MAAPCDAAAASPRGRRPPRPHRVAVAFRGARRLRTTEGASDGAQVWPRGSASGAGGEGEGPAQGSPDDG